MLRKRVDGGGVELEITSGPFSHISIYFCVEQGLLGGSNTGLPQLWGAAGVRILETLMMCGGCTARAGAGCGSQGWRNLAQELLLLLGAYCKEPLAGNAGCRISSGWYFQPAEFAGLFHQTAPEAGIELPLFRHPEESLSKASWDFPSPVSWEEAARETPSPGHAHAPDSCLS